VNHFPINHFLISVNRFQLPGEEIRLPVRKEDYVQRSVGCGMMKLHAAASVKETHQIWVAEDDFQMIVPALSVQVLKPFVWVSL